VRSRARPSHRHAIFTDGAVLDGQVAASNAHDGDLTEKVIDTFIAKVKALHLVERAAPALVTTA
jgi:hypothetical protein